MTAIIILLGNLVPVHSLEASLIHLRVDLRDLVFEDVDQSFVRSIAAASTIIVEWLEHLVLDALLDLLHEIAENKFIMTFLAVEVETAIY